MVFAPSQMPVHATPHSKRPISSGQKPGTVYRRVDSAPMNSAGMSIRRRGMRSISMPAGPLVARRISRLAESISPTSDSAIPAARVCVGSTTYSVASPSSDSAKPRPSSDKARSGRSACRKDRSDVITGSPLTGKKTRCRALCHSRADCSLEGCGLPLGASASRTLPRSSGGGGRIVHFTQG